MSRPTVPALTVFLSAALLFLVQPMAAKRLLPPFGGGAAVWTTALLLFQSLLLVGYAYAHGLARWLPRRTAAIVHAVLLTAAATLLMTYGVLPSASWKPAGDATQGRLLIALAMAVGLPYVLLSATAPLVQAWHGGGRGAYRLYAVSNAGSLLALLSYPLLIEPWADLAVQDWVWTGVFVGFAVLCIVCGGVNADGSLTPFAAKPLTASTADSVGNGVSAVTSPSSGTSSSLVDRATWVVLPACGTAALLAITNHLCQDVAPVPLLWVAPLAVYLLSYILAFAGERWTPRWPWAMAVAVLAAAAAVGTWPGVRLPFAAISAIDLALLLAIGVVCHGEVARRRPAAADATGFYFCLSIGGALGGLLVAVVAPLVLDDYYEWPIVLLAGWVVAVLTLPSAQGGLPRTVRWTGVALGTLVLALLAGTPFTVARAVAVESDRDFFGVFKVQEGDLLPGVRLRRMMHGHISHGAQFTDPVRRREPAQYYDATSGIGRLMHALAGRPKRVAVIGLGTGTMAAFAEAGDAFVFYEISPSVIDLARRHFTYLSDACERGARVDVLAGDGRLLIERDADAPFDLIVLDAFSGDAVPVHLLTREAFESYRRRLAPGGVLAVNVTNHNVNLLPVLAATADRLRADLRVVRSTPDLARAVHASTWAMLFTDVGLRVGDDPDVIRPVVWTDERSSLLPVLKWR